MVVDLSSVADQVNKELGYTIAVAGDEAKALSEINYWISTGSSALDTLLGGGFPSGRTVEISGKQHSGKSTVLVKAMTNCHKLGGYTLLLDSENAMFWDRAFVQEDFDRSRNMLLEGDSVEACFRSTQVALEGLIEQGVDGPVLVGWDTIAATGTEKEGKMAGMKKAQAIQEGFRDIRMLLGRANACLVIVNQVISGGPGRANMTPGGKALKFYPSIRLKLWSGGMFEDPPGRSRELSNPGGTLSYVRVLKNKVHRYIATEIPVAIHFDLGIDEIQTNFHVVEESGVVPKTGNGWYKFGEVEDCPVDKSIYEKHLFETLEEYEGFDEWLQKKAIDYVRTLF